MEDRRLAPPRLSSKDSKMSQSSILSTVAPAYDRSYGYRQLPPDGGISRRSLNSAFPPASPSRSDKSHNGNLWNMPFANPSISEVRSNKAYEMPETKAGQEYQLRPDINATGPREQLPSLSSILGGQHSGSMQPSYPELTPPYSVTSQDSRRSSASVGRQPWGSVPPPAHSNAPHFPYEQRPSQTVTTEPFQPPQRLSNPQNRVLGSPRPHDVKYTSQGNGPFSHASMNHWSPHPEAPYGDYYPSDRDTSSSFRSGLDSRQPLPSLKVHGGPDRRPPFHDISIPTPSTPIFPPTTSTSTVSGIVTTKDGLGPKIWTGTQFLPRFVRQAEFPGEGMCYFYDDGTHCKTHIDGEAVNAHWGVTKAGKPRKRLAIACITCREKKIKCDPDFPRCVQCEKFGRVCKFKNAPRGGQGSPEASSAEVDDIPTRPQSQQSDHDSIKSEQHDVTISVSSPIPLSHPLPELELLAAKRRRNGYHESSPVAIANDQKSFAYELLPLAKDRMTEATPTLITRFEWPDNPFDVDEPLAMELMGIYFANVTSTTYSLFPEGPFMRWLTDRGCRKSEEHILLIYALLAVATIFSTRSDSKKRGVEFASVSSIAFSRDYSLPVVQSRFLFAVYFDSIDEADRSWDALGAAIRAAIGIDLHLDLPSTSESRGDISDSYGFSQGSLAECKRRTFWSCFIMDRLGVCRDGRFSTMQTDDIFLRMPSDNKHYEGDRPVTNPFFDIDLELTLNPGGTFGTMSYLVAICSTWGDIMSQIYRASRRARKPDLAFYDTMLARLENWHMSLPPCITNSIDNFRKQIEFRLLGSFLTMHAVYYTAAMKLNTEIDSSMLSGIEADNRARTARRHAEALLRLAGQQAASREKHPDNPSAVTPVFMGYAISTAVEILAKGKLSDSTLTLLEGGVHVLNELERTWPVVTKQKANVVARLGYAHTMVAD